MGDNIRKTKEYFDRKSEKLEKIKIEKQNNLVKTVKWAIENKLYGVVLDIGIGIGGSFYYSTENVKKVIGIDISYLSLAKAKKIDKFYYIACSAYQLAFNESLFDCVVLTNVLHHFAGDSLEETKENLLNCFVETKRVLKEGGKVFIVEAFCNRLIEKMESSLYKIYFKIVKIFNKPLIYYFSFYQIKEILSYCGFKNIVFTHLKDKNIKLCPFDATFGLPLRYFGLNYILVEANK
ncbi:MAG: class I SAM-dependent methyltransferase [Candidatus Omnitrophica bacterium]|nr:class I SAM-dependent methyltransferase [Candidatus Omnitrophota bacterium]